MSETISPHAASATAADLSATANELRAAAEAKILQFTDALKKEDLKTLTNRAVNEAAARWKELSTNAAVFVRESPGRAALAALGIGFAIGLLFRRD
ncbi:MAG TPA: hypothetical protein VG796_10910 [Verrucomicrobiales bacterium]|nr:hypothetical protein [Verrucomicrobiales bacterium]